MAAQKGHLYSMAPSLNWTELMPFDGFRGSVGISPHWHQCKSQQANQKLTVGQEYESLLVIFSDDVACFSNRFSTHREMAAGQQWAVPEI